MVELNHTFHQVQPRREDINALGSQLEAAGLKAVVKVSRRATHEQKLEDPERWWTSLWTCYRELQRRDLLIGLLWQLPPSFEATDGNVESLERLLTCIQSGSGVRAKQIFDFRHSSWYSSARVHSVLRRRNACLAWLHVRNDASRWAGNLQSGWSTSVKTADFVYLRLFGSKGRSIGQYSDDFLTQEVARWLQREAFVVFGQGDVPVQALSNAQSLLRLVAQPVGDPPGVSAVPDLSADQALVSGAVRRVTDGSLVIDLEDGREAVIGTRHLNQATLSANLSKAKRQGRMRFHIGEQLPALQVEYIDPETKRVFLRAAGADEPPERAQREAPASEESEDEKGFLPSPGEVGVDQARVLEIMTWGNSKMKPPKAQLHVTCNYKKFHYLTRNNKHIKWLNGLDAEVKDRVRRSAFLESWLRDTLPQIEGQNVQTVALHCHKGTHLSVAIAELMQELYYPNATVQHLSLRAERAGRRGGPARH